jgi:hypothetical protein
VYVIPPKHRKSLEDMGEAYVRQASNGGVTPDSFEGSPDQFKTAAVVWLAEIDDAARKRTEALQAEQRRLSKSTLKAAWIAVVAAALGIIVTAGLWYAQYVTPKAEVAHNKMIRESIGQYIGTGRALMDKFGRNEMPMPIADEVGWISITENFLRTNLDESYVNRFNDVSGLGSVTGVGTDAPHSVHYNNIYLKITRLEEFSHELPR